MRCRDWIRSVVAGADRFARDRAGAVGMLVALSVIPVAAGIGLAVDFGRVYAVDSHTQASLDAAALAAGRVSQVEKVDTVNKASAAANAYFAATKPTNVPNMLELLPRLGSHVQEAILGQKDVEDALNDAEEEVNGILAS